MKAVTAGSIFDGWWGRNEEEAREASKAAGYPFLLKVVVSKDIPPRHPYFDWMRGLGSADWLFTSIFTGAECSRMGPGGGYLMAFPENKMSMAERQLFLYKVKEHPNFSTLDTFEVLTSAPFIISDTPKECISIIGFPEGTTDKERYKESETGGF